MEDKIYNKIERMDEKLDLYIKEMEGRVTKVEAKVASHQGFIKAGFAALLSVVGSVIAYITKQLTN